jgi:hypothetical protein
MPEVSIHKRRAEDYADMITGWQDVRMTGMIKHSEVQISHRVVICLIGKAYPVEFVRSVSGEVFIWAGDNNSKKTRRYLEKGFLIIENRIYMPLVDAFIEKNDWVWTRLK